MIVDTHCHLDFDRFSDDLDDVFARAADAGVAGYVLIGINPDSWRATQVIAEQRSNVWRAAGLHPNSVSELWDTGLLAALQREVESGELVAVGEIGVDLYRSDDSRELQLEAFEAQLLLAQNAGLPVVIHQRAAESEVLDVLRRHQPVAGVMHCFSGDWDFARACLEVGLHLGVGGIATFPSAAATREAIRQAPLDRLLLETDAPFLAPQPVRGKRNEPAYLAHVVDTVAGTCGVSSASIEEETTRNAINVFGLTI